MLPQVGMPTHKIDGDKHDAAGLTPGHVLTASGAAAFAFQAAAGGGVVSKATDHTYPGDGTDNRLIDLGDDYDFIWVFCTAALPGTNEPYKAWAFKDIYGCEEGATTYALIHTQAGADALWQGKSGDSIHLGNDGGASTSFNRNGKTYRVIGLKFSAME